MRHILKVIVAVLAGSVALVGMPNVSAQGQAGRGACLAVTNTLSTPQLLLVDSTNGAGPPNAGMTQMQLGAQGYLPVPWIIQPGGPTWLLFPPDSSAPNGSYLVSQNGNFTVNAAPLPVSSNPHYTFEPAPFYSGLTKISFAVHPELTENGACKGTVVATLS